LYRLDDGAEIPVLENSVQYWVQQAREQNQQIRASEFALRAAQEHISEQKGAYMPRVTFIAQRQDSNTGFDNSLIPKTDTTYLGLDFTIPLYAGGSNRAAISEAVSQRAIAESELRQIQLLADERVRTAYLQVQSSAIRTSAARVLVESAELSAQAMQQGFDLGTVTSVDVLIALRDQYRAERDLQRTRYEHIKYLLLLKRETGSLSAEDMLEIGSWLIPPQR
jgi:outer membrane protein